jgi:LuxR family maltose regulon positive regulatory protein
VWHEQHDEPDRAIRHAIASGDRERAAELIWALAPAYAFGGKCAILEAWLSAFADGAVVASARLALTAAVVQIVRNDRDRVEHWLRAAERLEPATGDPDALAGAAAVLRAALLPRAPGHTTAVPLDSALLALERLAGGIAHHLSGDREGAAVLLHEGARLGAVAAPVLRALCLAQLGILAAEAGSWEEAALHAGRAHAQVESAHAGAMPIVALVHAVCAAVDAHRGHPETARREALEAKRLLDDSCGPVPWLAAEARIWLARTAIRLSDVTDARGLLAQAARSRREVHDDGVLEQWIDDTWARADAFAAGGTGVAPTLTIAELRVLRFLPSHLSFREIGDRLHVSANTVKTQALAVYRKLDASSRSEAVTRGRAVGLLDG